MNEQANIHFIPTTTTTTTTGRIVDPKWAQYIKHEKILSIRFSFSFFREKVPQLLLLAPLHLLRLPTYDWATTQRESEKLPLPAATSPTPIPTDQTKGKGKGKKITLCIPISFFYSNFKFFLSPSVNHRFPTWAG